MDLTHVLDALEPLRSRKERAILEGGLRLFSERGYRHTSMEEIALQAGVAKGTIYLYFANKELLFRSLCSYLVDYVMAQVRDTTLQDAPYSQRIQAALRTKFGFLYRVVTAAPHGRDLIDSRDQLAADIFNDFDATFEHTITSLVDRGITCGELHATKMRLAPRTIAQTFIVTMRGVSVIARDIGDFDRRTEAALTLLFEGLRR